MRIAQIAPLIESVPPRLYGGTERVVSYLTEELVRLGHQVTLFATGDSQTAARLIACAPRALRMDLSARDILPYQILQLEALRQRQHEFDILHFHSDYLHLPLFRPYAHKTVTTMHGRLDLPELHLLYREFDEMPLVSISNAQRRPMPPVNWAATIYHGLPADVCHYNPHAQGGYFAFLGRISPEKRLDRAIEIARATGMPLKVAAKVDRADQSYFEARIRPLLRDRLVEFVGEIGEGEKSAFLGGATALLFPIDWPEPFGLVMIEAMSCGTPVLAWNCGSVPEIIEPGVSGYIVQSMNEAIAAARAITYLDRAQVRQSFERRFSARRMAYAYADLYAHMLHRQANSPMPARLDARAA